ncbi:MAG: hypothetical protein EOP84_29305, partial [Verrucomicrobiaceae bacterium]
MNSFSRGLGAVMLAVCVAPAIAQAPLLVGGAQLPMLRAGTPVPMRNTSDLTTNGKHLRVGQRVPLEVAESVRLNGQVVIPAGSPGMGEITTVRNKGMWGKSGGITARVLYVRVGDRQIRLSGTFDDKGTTGTAAVVGAVLLIPVVGFFTTGTSAKIPVGAPVSAFLDEDVPVAFAAGTPVQAPLQATPTGQAVTAVSA